MCAFLEAAARERNISGDHDVVRLHVLDNPVICRIEPVIYNFEGNPSFIGNSHPGVGHQCDIKVISCCDAVHLRFDRARISIDKDMQQTFTLPSSGILSGRHLTQS